MSMLTTLGDIYRGKSDLLSPARSSKWPAVRAEYLKTYGKCAVCNGTKKLEVHHKLPYHVHPELELDPSNFITLCEAGTYGINCHLLVGHLGHYKSINRNVDIDASEWNTKLSGRPTNAKLVE
jgi:hypothetical protein